MPDDMKEIGFMLVITVPSRMTTGEAAAALGTCISFGKPQITKVFEVPAGRPAEDVIDTL
jgi:hypothetical protein